MAISQKVSVTTDRKTIAPVVYAVQGDTGRQIVAEYSDFQLAAGMTGVFAFTRSDGTSYSVPATIDPAANTATAEMDQALTQVGKTKGQIKITDSSGLGSTFTFYIDVQEDLSGTPTEQQYYDIQAAVEAAAEAKAEADQVLEDLGPISQINDRLTDAEEELDNKANVDGTYPSLTAGLAEQLLSSNRVTDQTPYLYRQTALGKANATRALMKKIVGGSVVWNQLCNGSSVTVPSGHKYAAKIGGSWSISASTGTAITGLTAGTDMVTDLTALFGSATIADYIYPLEQATAGSGIAKLREWGFFTEDYYDYDPGTMRSVEGVSAKETVGFNLWDGLKSSGYITDTGRINASANYYYTDYVRVFPNTEYHFHGTGGANPSVVWYDEEKEFVDGTKNDNETERTLISPSNARYVRASFPIENVDTFCINLSDPQRNGEYEPYVKHTYPLDSSLTLRGIPKLDANNRLYYDGDTYESDGTVTRRYGIVDLGTLNWITRTTGSVNKVLSSLLPSEYIGNENDKIDLISNYAYVSATNAAVLINSVDTATVGVYTYNQTIGQKSGSIYMVVPKDSIPSGSVVYELATPTTETAEPYTEVQVVDKDGTEQFVTTGIVPVGHVTEYPEDLVGKLDAIPNPPTDAGRYVLQATVASGKVTYAWAAE